MQLKPAIRKATELGIALTAVATLVLAGCGGKSSSGSAAADMTTLSISPSLGRFSQGANVRIRDRSGIQIGSGYTDASGVASIAVPTSAQAPLLVEAGLNGDRYYDEKQGLFVSVSGVNGVAVRALVPDHTATSQVAVTALTEIAVGSLTNASGVVPVGVSAASAVGANATVAQSFGVTDLLVPPKLVGSKTDVNGLGSTEADKYALKLAALANMAGTGEDALKVAHRLRNDLNLATPASGIAATITAMKAFMVSMPSAPAGATTIANAIVVPHANAKLVDLIPAAMNAANTQLAALDPALTKAQIIAAINTAALNNASGVMAAIATGQVPASAIQAALQQAQQQASSATTAVTGFSPASGVAGTSVTITGAGFDPFYMHNTVKFNGTLATVTAGSTTSLTVTVPAAAATGRISVTNTMSPLLNKTGTSANSFTVNTPAGSEPASVGTSLPVSNTLTAPALLNLAVMGTSQIDLYWPQVTGATSYNIYRSTTPGVQIVPSNRIATTASAPAFNSSYQTTGLTAATTYYYKVTAVNATGESLGSVELSAKTALSSITPNVLAGSKTAAGNVDNTTGTLARFGRAMRMASDAAGNLYVADSINHSIRKITPTGAVTTIATSINVGGITADSAGVVYVTDLNSYSVKKISSQGISTLAGGTVANCGLGKWSCAGSNVDATTGTSATFSSGLRGIAIDAVGNLYVADTGNYNIRKITQSGVVTTLAGPDGATCQATTDGICPYGNTNGTGINARFVTMDSVAVDVTGNVYVSERQMGIRKITSTGVVSMFAKAPIAAFGVPPDNGLTVQDPSAIVIGGASGNLYVADATYRNHIHVITPVGDVSTAFVLGAGEVDGLAIVGTTLHMSVNNSSGTGSYVPSDASIQSVANVVQ
ncbi:MAG: hypothetical protein EPO42_00025, partial [Gallionellaceae bacterium]